MADVSRGGVSTMPGSSSSVPAGTMCDDHEDRPAVRRIQGETDSFGCEYLDLCQECVDKLRAAEATIEGTCDYCKTHTVGLLHHRDWEEGSSGPVYRICRPCKTRSNEALANEFDDQSDWDSGWYDDGN